ncbi:MAG: dihydropteroate synthase [Desulfobulbaceae bacterium]|nr:dihydropteroate synthase [Desulfobulbaceae bacterium]MCK5438113.1 dihydropteroate synthase [Desulfobulbaceae bacterium]
MITIAEKINATIPSVKKIIETRDRGKLLELARTQSKAGADYLDVNVGTGTGSRQDEIDSMRWAVTMIQEEVETPLCIDSADPDVLAAGLAARDGRPALINSTKGSDEHLNKVVPLAREYGQPLVGLAMDEEGIPATVTARVAACSKIVSTCAENRVGMDNVFFDPLVLPVSTDVKQGLVTLETIRALKEQFQKAHIVMAVSNVSFGLPERRIFNTAFLHMAIFAGLDTAILDVLNPDLMGAIKTAEAIMGRDRHCRKYARFWRNR